MVYVSALEMFSIGVGPSSSHTVGPMRAGRDFALRVLRLTEADRVTRVDAVLLGSLAATGVGHGTPDALVAGLRGAEPETCDPAEVTGAWARYPDGEPLRLGGRLAVSFTRESVAFESRTRAARHPNALILRAWGTDAATPLLEETYFSVGGRVHRARRCPGTRRGRRG